MEWNEYDTMLRTLLRIAANQDSINDDLRAFNAQQLVINDRLASVIERLDTTLARLFRAEGNGHAA